MIPCYTFSLYLFLGSGDVVPREARGTDVGQLHFTQDVHP